MGMRMLIGILHSREGVVSLEAYPSPSPVQPGEHEKANTCPNKADETSAADRVDNDRKSRAAESTTSASTSGSISTAPWTLPQLQHHFSRLAEDLESIICHFNTECFTINTGLPIVATASQLRRVLVFSLIQMVSRDLPTELPTLLLWSFAPSQMVRSPLTNRRLLFKCLNEYINSSLETQAVEALWDRMYGSHGSPRFAMPHSRRAESLSYEQQIQECSEKRREAALECEDEPENRASSNSKSTRKSSMQYLKHRPPVEQFALRCRWNRIDSLVSEGGVSLLLPVLVQAVNDAVDVLIQLEAASRHPSSGSSSSGSHKSSLPTSITTSDASYGFHNLTLQCATLALEVICSMILNGNYQTVSIVFREGVQRIWTFTSKFGLLTRQLNNLLPLSPSVSTVHNATTTNGSSGLSTTQLTVTTGELQIVWWRTLALSCQQNVEFAAWIWAQQGTDILVAALSISLGSSTNSSVGKIASELSIWSTRLWRVFVAYGYGVKSVTDYLLALHVQGQSSSPLHESCMPQSNVQWSCFTGSEILRRMLLSRIWLLEEAAVTVTSVIRQSMLQLKKLFNRDSAACTGETIDLQESNLQESDSNYILTETATNALSAAVQEAIECAQMLVSAACQCQEVLHAESIDEIADAATDANTATGDRNLKGILRAAMLNFIATVFGPGPLQSNVAGYDYSSPEILESSLGLVRGQGLCEACLEFSNFFAPQDLNSSPSPTLFIHNTMMRNLKQINSALFISISTAVINIRHPIVSFVSRLISSSTFNWLLAERDSVEAQINLRGNEFCVDAAGNTIVGVRKCTLSSCIWLHEHAAAIERLVCAVAGWGFAGLECNSCVSHHIANISAPEQLALNIEMLGRSFVHSSIQAVAGDHQSNPIAPVLQLSTGFVADGLFRWHHSRLHAIRLLCRIHLVLIIRPNSHNTTSLSLLSSVANSFTRITPSEFFSFVMNSLHLLIASSKSSEKLSASRELQSHSRQGRSLFQSHLLVLIDFIVSLIIQAATSPKSLSYPKVVPLSATTLEFASLDSSLSADAKSSLNAVHFEILGSLDPAVAPSYYLDVDGTGGRGGQPMNDRVRVQCGRKMKPAQACRAIFESSVRTNPSFVMLTGDLDWFHRDLLSIENGEKSGTSDIPRALNSWIRTQDNTYTALENKGGKQASLDENVQEADVGDTSEDDIPQVNFARLSSAWWLEILYNLKGESFHQWLIVLFAAQSAGFDMTRFCPVESLFVLVNLATLEHAPRWLNITTDILQQEHSGNSEGATGKQSAVEGFADNVDLNSLVNDEAVVAYVGLAMTLFCQVFVSPFASASAKHFPSSPSGLSCSNLHPNVANSTAHLTSQRGIIISMNYFLDLSNKHFYTSYLAASSKSKNQQQPLSAANINSTGEPVSDAGAIELASKLLESFSSQYIHQAVHAMALGVFLYHPLAPPRVLQKIWSEVGNDGILHLLDIDVDFDCGKLPTPWSPSSGEALKFPIQGASAWACNQYLLKQYFLINRLVAQASVVRPQQGFVARAAINSLLATRSLDDRVSMSAYQLGVLVVVEYLFGEQLACNHNGNAPVDFGCIDGPRSRLLVSLIDGSIGRSSCSSMQMPWQAHSSPTHVPLAEGAGGTCDVQYAVMSQWGRCEWLIVDIVSMGSALFHASMIDDNVEPKLAASSIDRKLGSDEITDFSHSASGSNAESSSRNEARAKARARASPLLNTADDSSILNLSMQLPFAPGVRKSVSLMQVLSERLPSVVYSAG